MLLNAAKDFAAGGHAADLADGHHRRGGGRLRGRRRAARQLVAFRAKRWSPDGTVQGALAAPGARGRSRSSAGSPSAGDLRPGADPARLARAFDAAGAAAVSILVDERFGGSGPTSGPRAPRAPPPLSPRVLQRPSDLSEARACGADATLLLLRDLDDSQRRPSFLACGELGLDALVEAHDADELERAIALTPEYRDQRPRPRHVRDRPGGAAALAASAPATGSSSPRAPSRNQAQAAEAELAGADAILVGSALMRALDPAAKLASSSRARSSRCAG